jgi:Rod binding domain-containing protein
MSAMTGASALVGTAQNALMAGTTPPRLPGGSAPRTEDAMRVGRQFEQMFLSQMLAPVFETIETEGPFGGGHGEEMMRSFQIDAYAQAISRRGGIGLAPNIASEILRMQENSNG